MAQTGESYTAARAVLLRKAAKAKQPKSSSSCTLSPYSSSAAAKNKLPSVAPAAAAAIAEDAKNPPQLDQSTGMAAAPGEVVENSSPLDLPKPRRSMMKKKLEETMRALGQSVPASEKRGDQEAWLLSRGWQVKRPGRVLLAGGGRLRRAEEDWIDTTGLDHSFELAVDWQLWTDASKLVESLGWGYRGGGRDDDDLRVDAVRVPREITGKTNVTCSVNRALRYYLENRERADFYAKLFREGRKRSEWPKYEDGRVLN